MRVNTNNGKKNKNSEIAILDLIILGVIMILAMLASAIVGILYFDKATVVAKLEQGKVYLTSLFHNEIVSEAYLQNSNALNTLTLDIPFDSYSRLLEKRQEALAKGILISSDDDMVDAKATLNSEDSVKIQLRLKGDWVDHLTGTKWSYRIHTKGNTQIMGMTSFSIQSPDTRNYLAEWGYHQNLFLEGLLTTHYEFVNVIENGKYMGVYAIEDSFTTTMLESEEKRAGIILRFDEDAMWINRANFSEESMDMLYDAREEGLFMVTENEQADVSIFQENSITSNPILAAEADTAVQLLQGFMDGTLTASQVFDVQKFGKFLAITDLWGANHATFWHNLRYYYNPVTSLIEPIGYDGNALTVGDGLAVVFLGQAFFDHPEIRRAYAEELDRVTQAPYLSWLNEKLQPGLADYLKPLQDEYGTVVVHEPWQQLAYRRGLLQNQLHPPFPVLGRYQIKSDDQSVKLVTQIKNLMILPVDLISLSIQADDELITLDAKGLTSSGDFVQNTALPEIRYVNTLKGVMAPTMQSIGELTQEQYQKIIKSELVQITAQVKISGLQQVYQVPLLPLNNQAEIDQRPTTLFANAESDLSRHPFLQKINDHTIIVHSGDWNVNGDLIIPQDYQLFIMPGTTLRFDEKAIFLVGNNFHANGTVNSPILLTSKSNQWGGIIVLSAPGQSDVVYTTIENTGTIERNGWVLTGGVTFYESPVELYAVEFKDHAGEDALNIIHSDYSMNRVAFSNSFADALDTDFSDGTLQDCSFYQIGGDAVDVSGSHVKISNTKMTLITDKAVSAGEQSIVILDTILIDTANIGIASKDLSEVTAVDINLHDVPYAGFAAYIKKPVYGPGTITASGIVTTNVETLALVQDGNTVILDGEVMPTTSLDVKTLYELGILGN